MKRLTNKQSLFVQEYLVDLNATQAAIRAGYSKKTAYSVGHENLKKPEIQKALAKAQQKRAERLEITADDVVRELALIGFSSVRNYTVDHEGNVDLSQDAPASAMQAVSGIDRKRTLTTRPDGTEIEHVDVKVRLWNKNTALQDLGKHLGMFGPKGTADDPENITIRILRGPAP